MLQAAQISSRKYFFVITILDAVNNISNVVSGGQDETTLRYLMKHLAWPNYKWEERMLNALLVKSHNGVGFHLKPASPAHLTTITAGLIATVCCVRSYS